MNDYNKYKNDIVYYRIYWDLWDVMFSINTHDRNHLGDCRNPILQTIKTTDVYSNKKCVYNSNSESIEVRLFV